MTGYCTLARAKLEGWVRVLDGSPPDPACGEECGLSKAGKKSVNQFRSSTPGTTPSSLVVDCGCASAGGGTWTSVRDRWSSPGQNAPFPFRYHAALASGLTMALSSHPWRWGGGRVEAVNHLALFLHAIIRHQPSSTVQAEADRAAFLIVLVVCTKRLPRALFPVGSIAKTPLTRWSAEYDNYNTIRASLHYPVLGRAATGGSRHTGGMCLKHGVTAARLRQFRLTVPDLLRGK